MTYEQIILILDCIEGERNVLENIVREFALCSNPACCDPTSTVAQIAALDAARAALIAAHPLVSTN